MKNKSIFVIFSFIILVAVVILTMVVLRTRLFSQQIAITTKNLALATPKKDGITTDKDVVQKSVWLTGTIKKIEIINTNLPASESSSGRAIDVGLYKLTLSVANQPYAVTAFTLLASTLNTTTDNQHFIGLFPADLFKKIGVGDKVSLGLLTEKSSNFKNEWTRAYGSWTDAGRMFSYLADQYRNDMTALTNQSTLIQPASNYTVVFNQVFY